MYNATFDDMDDIINVLNYLDTSDGYVMEEAFQFYEEHMGGGSTVNLSSMMDYLLRETVNHTDMYASDAVYWFNYLIDNLKVNNTLLQSKDKAFCQVFAIRTNGVDSNSGFSSQALSCNFNFEPYEAIYVFKAYVDTSKGEGFGRCTLDKVDGERLSNTYAILNENVIESAGKHHKTDEKKGVPVYQVSEQYLKPFCEWFSEKTTRRQKHNYMDR